MSHKVVQSTLGDLSIVPAAFVAPVGWRDTGVEGSADECAEWVANEAVGDATSLARRSATAGGRDTWEALDAAILRDPAKVAVRDSGNALSYAALGDLIVRVRSYLRDDLGLGANDVVGVRAERSAVGVAVMLGVMNAGLIYLPIDPGVPVERLRELLADSEASVVISHNADGSEWIGAASRARVVHIREILSESTGRVGHLGQGQQDFGYLIYTSGSTGKPKAVHGTGAGLAWLIAAHHEMVRPSVADVFSQVTSFAFDASFWEILPALAAGATVEIADDLVRADARELWRWLLERRITVTLIMPFLLCSLTSEELHDTGSLREVHTGGDRVQFVPSVGVTLRNVYGPTETTVAATAGLLRTGLPHIGQPLAGVTAYVTDDDLRPLPIGAAGELLLGGDGITMGYWRRPGATALRFVPNTLGSESRLLYRTGDVVRWNDDGDLEYLGRTDRQLKISGNRVEPGEIEAVIRDARDVRDVVVVSARDDAGGDELVLAAYVTVANQADEEVVSGELRQTLDARLPSYMRPNLFVVGEIPLTANGKVDVASLRKAAQRQGMPRLAVETEPLSPTTELEQLVCDSWMEILGRPPAQGSDFFESGGDSLQALRVVGRLRLGGLGEIGVRVIFDNPVIEDLIDACSRYR